MNKHILPLLAAALVVITACQPAPAGPDDTTRTSADRVDPAASPRAVLMGEGGWGMNNASLALVDNRQGTVVADWFERMNGRGLGDLAQDIILYGSSLYVTVSESGSLEVVDTATGRSQRVDLGTAYPRYIAASGGKLYVSCYNPHCVIRIDTSSLAVEARCELGDYNPEGLAVAAGRLFVASSNVSDQSGSYSYDSVLYVVDLASFDMPSRLVVGSNPQCVIPVDSQRVAVTYWGDYGQHPAGAAVVDATTLGVRQLPVALSGLTVHDGDIYGYASTYSADYSTKVTDYYRIDIQTLEASPILAGCGVDRPYAIGVDPRNGDILLATDGNYSAAGRVHCFSADGKQRWQGQAGFFPSKFIFLP
ncbi:MAG: hypothetical protein IJ760_08455 [Bacteroidales bacterium]|nr:hypothetical protein [Bacteroidales bacterium]